MAADEELAAEIRALALTLHRTAAPDDVREEAASLMRRANELLDSGVDRLRWHELAEAESDGRRGRTRDLSPWSGALNAVAPPMRLERGERNGEPCMVGEVQVSRLREGPAAGVHGGVLAGLFDEILAAGVFLTGRTGAVTGKLTVRYRKVTPIDTDLVFRSWVQRDRGLRVEMRAECLLAADVHVERPRPTADASAIFVRVR